MPFAAVVCLWAKVPCGEMLAAARLPHRASCKPHIGLCCLSVSFQMEVRGKKSSVCYPIQTGPLAFSRIFPLTILAQNITSVHSYRFEIIL